MTTTTAKARPTDSSQHQTTWMAKPSRKGRESEQIESPYISTLSSNSLISISISSSIDVRTVWLFYTHSWRLTTLPDSPPFQSSVQSCNHAKCHVVFIHLSIYLFVYLSGFTYIQHCNRIPIHFSCKLQLCLSCDCNLAR